LRIWFLLSTRATLAVPILQFGISSTKLNEQQTFAIAMNQFRVGLISVPGISIPYPYGGKQRVVSVDLDPKAIEANNMQSKANFSKFQHAFAGAQSRRFDSASSHIFQARILLRKRGHLFILLPCLRRKRRHRCRDRSHHLGGGTAPLLSCWESVHWCWSC
jgi:hypothetical protein